MCLRRILRRILKHFGDEGGFITFGSPYAEKQQTKAAEEQARLAEFYNTLFKQYYPQVLQGLQEQTQPGNYYDLLSRGSEQAINRGTSNLMSNTFANAQRTGMMNSGQTQNLLGMLSTNNAGLLSQNSAQYQQMEDERRNRALSMLGQFTSGAGQNAGMMSQSAGNAWGQRAAAAWGPVMGLMTMSGSALGNYVAGRNASKNPEVTKAAVSGAM